MAAPALDGRQVLLIASQSQDDLDGEWLELALRGMRNELGLEPVELPVVLKAEAHVSTALEGRQPA